MIRNRQNTLIVRKLSKYFHVLLKYSAGPSNDSLCDIDLKPYILDFDYTDP